MSVAFAAIQLTGSDSTDGIVLTSSVLDNSDNRSHKNLPVPDLAIDKIQIPVLVVHHEKDGCFLCQPSALPGLMHKLSNAPRKELWTVSGGQNTLEHDLFHELGRDPRHVGVLVDQDSACRACSCGDKGVDNRETLWRRGSNVPRQLGHCLVNGKTAPSDPQGRFLLRFLLPWSSRSPD